MPIKALLVYGSRAQITAPAINLTAQRTQMLLQLGLKTMNYFTKHINIQ